MSDGEGFVTVAKVVDIPAGEGRAYNVHGKRVAVFHSEEGFFAISDTCPHMGASLAEGYVEQKSVLCPWHAWKFCLEAGTWLDQPRSSIKADVFELEIAGDEIKIRVSVPKQNSVQPDA
jgi:nitrite reductase (NADH) small subunit